MKKIKVKLVTLGNLKYPVDFSIVENWKSEIFEAHHVDQIQALPDSDGVDWSYPDTQLSELIAPDADYDFTIGIINARLEDNFYLRPLANNVGVLSLHETAEILHYSNLALESFIVRIIYEVCAIYLESGRTVSVNATALVHDETRSCLYDLTANKADIIFSSSHPIICEPCKARIMGGQVPREFLATIEKELKRIKKQRYYRMVDFVKAHPLTALLITSATALILNIVANFIYDCIKLPIIKIVAYIGALLG
ncbi:MAG: hypothetical protein WA056_07640 [Gallionella sp.]